MKYRVISAAALAATSLMTGCDNDAHHTSDQGSAAVSSRDKRNAKYPDKSPKEIEAIMVQLGRSTMAAHSRLAYASEVAEILGPWVTPNKGPLYGHYVFPNVCYDGYFVRSWSCSIIGNSEFPDDPARAFICGGVPSDYIEILPPKK